MCFAEGIDDGFFDPISGSVGIYVGLSDESNIGLTDEAIDGLFESMVVVVGLIDDSFVGCIDGSWDNTVGSGDGKATIKV